MAHGRNRFSDPATASTAGRTGQAKARRTPEESIPRALPTQTKFVRAGQIILKLFPAILRRVANPVEPLDFQLIPNRPLPALLKNGGDILRPQANPMG